MPLAPSQDAALYGTSVDIHDIVEEDEFIAALHARAEKFDEHAEHAFGYLQVGVVAIVLYKKNWGVFVAGFVSMLTWCWSMLHLRQPDTWRNWPAHNRCLLPA